MDIKVSAIFYIFIGRGSKYQIAPDPDDVKQDGKEEKKDDAKNGKQESKDEKKQGDNKDEKRDSETKDMVATSPLILPQINNLRHDSNELGPYALTPHGEHCVGDVANPGYKLGPSSGSSGFRAVRASSCLNPNAKKLSIKQDQVQSHQPRMSMAQMQDAQFLKTVTRKDSFHKQNDPDDLDPLSVKKRAFRNSVMSKGLKPEIHKPRESSQFQESLHDQLITNLVVRDENTPCIDTVPQIIGEVKP